MKETSVANFHISVFISSFCIIWNPCPYKVYLGVLFTDWHEVTSDNFHHQDDCIFTIYVNAKFIGQSLRTEPDDMELRIFDYLFQICFVEVNESTDLKNSKDKVSENIFSAEKIDYKE